MKLYAAVWEDRHTDTTVHIFSVLTQAIKWARVKANEYDRFGDYEESVISGWEFYVKYSAEGDSIHIVSVEVDKEIKA